MTCLAVSGATNQQNVAKWQQNRSETIPYKIDSKQNLSMESVGGRYSMKCKGGFDLTLVPPQGGVWNMESVSVLGLVMKNTGPTDMTLYLSLDNAGATPWSDSSLGATVIKAGEELPLVVVLGRKNYKTGNAYYDKMSGLPSGWRTHWQTINPARVKDLKISCPGEGDHSFELAEMFPYQKIDPSAMGKFPFVDKYGQYIYGDWPGKVRSDRDIINGIAAEKKLEEELNKPTGFTKYGGWKQGPHLEATGAFRVQKYNDRWWFVDPEGCLFWSYGVSCVGIDWAGQSPLWGDNSVFADLPAKDDPKFGQFYTLRDVEGPDYTMIEGMPHYDFSRANLYRKYGKDWPERSVEQTIKRMQYCHLNTIGAWSDTNVVAQKKIPYVAMVHHVYPSAAKKLPDPFNPETRADLQKALREYPVDFRNDPWCLGAFVDNELHWRNNARDMVAAILGWNEEGTEAKKAFRDWLRNKYESVEAFNKAWGTSFAAWDDLLKVSDEAVFRKANDADCSTLATLFADAYFKMVKEELTAYAQHVLYLGCRINTAPGEVMKKVAEYADVVSVNDYSYRPNIGPVGSVDKPVLISEFHFVNVSGNNLGGGLRNAADAVQQGRLFRSFMELAVNDPRIVGAHWFEWNDQNVAGRHDGENYNVGFFDIADKPNVELVRAAEALGRILYQQRQPQPQGKP